MTRKFIHSTFTLITIVSAILLISLYLSHTNFLFYHSTPSFVLILIIPCSKLKLVAIVSIFSFYMRFRNDTIKYEGLLLGGEILRLIIIRIYFF